MDEKIRERMNGAYKNVQLSDDLKNQAEANLLSEVKRVGRWSISREVLAVTAVVIIFLVVNAVMIGLNLRKGNEVTPIESTGDFQKSVLAEFFAGLEVENYLVEYEGEAFREKDSMSRLNSILYNVVVTNVVGEPGNSILKISAQSGKGTETICWVDICDNGTVIIDGTCYQADVTEDAVSDIEWYRQRVFDMYLTDGAITKLEQIRTIDDVRELANCPNAFVKFFDEEEKSFCVAVLCYDSNGVRCTTDEKIATYVEYAYFEFDEQGIKVAESLKTFDAKSQEWEIRGAVEFSGEWYEVADGKEGGSAHYYEMTNIMNPEEMMYPSRFNDFDMENYISSNTQFFMDLVDDYIVVRDIENVDYGKVLDFAQVKTKVDLEKLMTQSNALSINYDFDDAYMVALAYNKDGEASSYTGQFCDLKIGFFELDGDEIEYSKVLEFAGDDNDIDYMGVVYYKGCYFLLGKYKDVEKYRIIGLCSGQKVDIKGYYCDEGICEQLLIEGEVQYFAQSSDVFWMMNEDMALEDAKDSANCTATHDWDEMCTSKETVRDIYVAQNWIGRSVTDFQNLAPFFGEEASVWYQDGNLFETEDSKKKAYQIEYSYSDLRYEVVTEDGNDEIVAVMLYGDHNYVTEDVWLGMNMEDVKERMGIADDAFFEKDGAKFTFFEKNGYLYELSFVATANGVYKLSYSCISDAAKIKSSPVKSFGERMEDGGNIFAQ